MQFPNGEQITLHRPVKVGVDGYGKDQYDWTDYPIPGCAFWPAGSVELVQGRETVTDSDTVAVPPESIPVAAGAILPTDEITVRGTRYKVNGKPQDYGAHPFTGTRYPILVRLEEVTG
jgi:hypothetical protein